MSSRFLDRVARGPLVLDAAMGTRLVAAGLDLATDDPCLWNLARPEVVGAIHARDVAAGAEAVFANTFGANRAWLTRFGWGNSVAAINRRGVELARAAAGPDRFVVGSIGPTPAGDRAALMEQVDALLDAGVDALALETFRLDQALAVLKHRPVDLRLGSKEPVLVGLFSWPEPIAATADRLIQAGATLVGINCADLEVAHRWLDAIAADGEFLSWLKPAAGTPGMAAATPADFAGLAARLAQVGHGLLGGCCGTTEAHVGAIAAAWGR